MSFAGLATDLVKQSVPGLGVVSSAINIAKDPLGAVFGKHSEYGFNPWHPPGDWRGAKARQDWEAKRKSLGYPPYTNAMGNAFTAWKKSGGKVANFQWPAPGVLQKSSPVMPGGAILQPGSGSRNDYIAAGVAMPGSGAMPAPRKRKAVRKKRRAARRAGPRRKRGKRMSALQRKYFGKRRKRSRRR